MNYSAKVKEIRKILKQGFYSTAINTIGTVFEFAFKHLYKDLMAELTPAERQKLSEAEKKFQINGMKQFSLGHWIGFYRKEKIIILLENKLSLNFKFFQIGSLDPMLDSRNDATHDGIEFERKTAEFSFNQLLYFLEESNLLVEEAEPLVEESEILVKEENPLVKEDAPLIEEGKTISANPLKLLLTIFLSFFILGFFIYYSFPQAEEKVVVEKKIKKSPKIEPVKTPKVKKNEPPKNPIITSMEVKIRQKPVTLPKVKPSEPQKTITPVAVATIEPKKEPNIPEKIPGRRIAVLYFDNNNSDSNELEPLRKGFTQMLISDIGNLSGITVVEREKLDQVLTELNLQQEKSFSPDSSLKIGRLLGAEYLLLGSFFELYEDFRIDAKLVKVETGEIVKTAGVNGKKEEFTALEKKLVDLIFTGTIN